MKNLSTSGRPPVISISSVADTFQTRGVRVRVVSRPPANLYHFVHQSPTSPSPSPTSTSSPPTSPLHLSISQSFPAPSSRTHQSPLANQQPRSTRTTETAPPRPHQPAQPTQPDPLNKLRPQSPPPGTGIIYPTPPHPPSNQQPSIRQQHKSKRSKRPCPPSAPSTQRAGLQSPGNPRLSRTRMAKAERLRRTMSRGIRVHGIKPKSRLDLWGAAPLRILAMERRASN